jgi:hypothetical protein
MAPVREFAWRNHVDMARQKDRFAASGTVKRSCEIRTAAEISTLLRSWLTSVLFQKRICVRLPEIRFEPGCGQLSFQVFLTFSLARTRFGWVSHHDALEANQVSQRFGDAITGPVNGVNDALF